MFRKLFKHMAIILCVGFLYYYRLWVDMPAEKKDLLMMIIDWLPLMVFTVYATYLTVGLGAFIVMIVQAFREDSHSIKTQTETVPKGWAADLDNTVSPMSFVTSAHLPTAGVTANDANPMRRAASAGVQSKHED